MEEKEQFNMEDSVDAIGIDWEEMMREEADRLKTAIRNLLAKADCDPWIEHGILKELTEEYRVSLKTAGML